MKFKLLILTLGLFSLSATANAKVQWNKKVMANVHADTIKGFLYEISHSVGAHPRLVHYRPKFAKALVWLNRVHADKKNTYILEKCAKDVKTKVEASIVLDTIAAIANVIKAKAPQYQTEFEINIALERWRAIGKKVIVEYNEKDVITAGKRETKIQWTFKLNTKKTKNLIEKW